MGLKVGYNELVDMLSKRMNTSQYKTTLFTKEYSRILQDAIMNGMNVDIVSICHIYFNYKSEDKIVDNDVFTFPLQVKELAHRLKWDEVLVSRMLREYLRLMKQKLEQGNKVNIKSILYIEPCHEDGRSWYNTRCNPNIEIPDSKYFMILNRGGNKSFVEIENNKLSLRVDLSHHLASPKNISERVELNRIDI